MVFDVFSSSRYLKIFNAIIELISILVVDNFARLEVPTKMFFHHISMLKNGISNSCRFMIVNCYDSIAFWVYCSGYPIDEMFVMLPLIGGTTTKRTEFLFIS